MNLLKIKLKKLDVALNELHKSDDVSNAAYSTLKFALGKVKECILPNICNVESCEKWQSLAKHKANLIAENEKLRQRLIESGLEIPAIQIDCSRHA